MSPKPPANLPPLVRGVPAALRRPIHETVAKSPGKGWPKGWGRFLLITCGITTGYLRKVVSLPDYSTVEPMLRETGINLSLA